MPPNSREPGLDRANAGELSDATGGETRERGWPPGSHRLAMPQLDAEEARLEAPSRRAGAARPAGAPPLAPPREGSEPSTRRAPVHTRARCHSSPQFAPLMGNLHIK